MTINDIKLNDVGKKLFLTFLFLVPIFFAANINLGYSTIRVAQEELFQIGAVILYAVILLENIYIAAFIILSVILYITHDFSGGNYLVNIFYGSVIYQIAYKVINSDNVEQVFKLVLWIIFLNVFYMIFQAIGVDFIFADISMPQYVMANIGFMGLKCFLGMICAMAIPFAFYFSPLVAIILVVPIWLSQTSIAILAAAVIFMFYAWRRLYKRRIFFGITMAVLILVSIIYVAQDSKMNMMTDRFNLWKVSLRDAFKRPIAGWGMDSFRNINFNGKKDFNYFKNVNTNEAFHGVYVPETGKFMFPANQMVKGTKIAPWDNAHNEYIQLFFEFGIFGIIILVMLAKDIVSRFNILDEKQVTLILFFTSFAVCAVAQFPAHVARLGVFLPAMLGIYYKLTDECKQKEIEIYGKA